MDRRQFVSTAGIVAGTMVASQVLADDKEKQNEEKKPEEEQHQEKKPEKMKDAGHSDHGHHDMVSTKPMAEKRPLSKEAIDLVKTTNDCVAAGKECMAHCFDVIKAGDLSMVDCQASVLNMLDVVDTVHSLINYNTASAQNLKALTATCRDFCKACKKECDIHRDHHIECKHCADACAQCISACDAYLKA